MSKQYILVVVPTVRPFVVPSTYFDEEQLKELSQLKADNFMSNSIGYVTSKITLVLGKDFTIPPNINIERIITLGC